MDIEKVAAETPEKIITKWLKRGKATFSATPPSPQRTSSHGTRRLGRNATRTSLWNMGIAPLHRERCLLIICSKVIKKSTQVTHLSAFFLFAKERIVQSATSLFQRL